MLHRWVKVETKTKKLMWVALEYLCGEELDPDEAWGLMRKHQLHDTHEGPFPPTLP